MGTLHTERGNLELTSAELALYRALSDERSRTFTIERLCASIGCTGRELGEHARTLRAKCSTLELDYVQCIWGVGYRLEAPYWETNAA